LKGKKQGKWYSTPKMEGPPVFLEKKEKRNQVSRMMASTALIEKKALPIF